ncbi:MAG: hypothetical protein HC846_06370 [Blastocatellia bacterium]|nr:hypothetical protein [Blastocatellia bacterium]
MKDKNLVIEIYMNNSSNLNNLSSTEELKKLLLNRDQLFWQTLAKNPYLPKPSTS